MSRITGCLENNGENFVKEINFGEKLRRIVEINCWDFQDWINNFRNITPRQKTCRLLENVRILGHGVKEGVTGLETQTCVLL